MITEDLRPLAVPVASLFESDRNVRSHPGVSMDVIVGSLERFGQRKPIVARHDGEVIAGNGTFKAAKILGWPEIAVVRFEGTEQEALDYAIADNRTAELSSWDRGKLFTLMRDLWRDDHDLALATGFDGTAIEEMHKAFAAMENALGGGSGNGEGTPGDPDERLPPEPPKSGGARTVEISSEEELTLWNGFVARVRASVGDGPALGDAIGMYLESMDAEVTRE